MLTTRDAVPRRRQVSVTLFRAGKVRARLVQAATRELPVLEAWLGRVGVLAGDEIELRAPAGRLVVRVTGEKAGVGTKR